MFLRTINKVIAACENTPLHVLLFTVIVELALILFTLIALVIK